MSRNEPSSNPVSNTPGGSAPPEVTPPPVQAPPPLPTQAPAPHLMRLLVTVFVAGALVMALGAGGGAIIVWYLLSPSSQAKVEQQVSDQRPPAPSTAPRAADQPPTIKSALPAP